MFNFGPSPDVMNRYLPPGMSAPPMQGQGMMNPPNMPPGIDVGMNGPRLPPIRDDVPPPNMAPPPIRPNIGMGNNAGHMGHPMVNPQQQKPGMMQRFAGMSQQLAPMAAQMLMNPNRNRR